MSVVVSFTVPGSTLPMTRALDAVSGGRIEVDRIIDRDDHTAAMFWIEHNGDLEPFEQTLEAQPRAENVVQIDEVEDRQLYRLDYNRERGKLCGEIGETDGTVLVATGTEDAAEVVVRFPDEDAAETFVKRCEEEDIPIHNVERANLNEALNELHPADAEFLSTAVEAGYFAGGASIEEIAEELDVDPSGLADRLENARQAVIDSIEN